MNRLTMRVASLTAATALAGAGLVAFTASPSSAHTGDLKVTAVCNTTTGNYDLTAKLTTSSVPSNVTGSSKWRVGTSTFQGTPTSDTGMDRGPVSSTGNTTVTLGSWSLPGTTTGLGPWVYAYTKWSNGTKRGSDGQLTQKLNGDCKQPEEPKVTICHRTASYNNPYTKITVARSAVDGVAGNSGNQPDHYGEHQGPIFYPAIPQGTEWGDIIPPVSGAHGGYNWTTQGQAVYNNDCKVPDVKVTPVADTLDPPSCTMPGKLSVPAQPAGVIVRVNNNVVTPPWSTTTPGTYAVAYSAAEHYVLSNNPSRTVEVLGKLDPNTNPDCRPDQPPNVKRYVPGSTEGCAVPGYGAGRLSWNDLYEDYYVWDETSRSYVLVQDTTPTRVNEQFVAYTQAELVEKGCVPVTPPPTPPNPPFECPAGQFYAGDLNHNGVMDAADCQTEPGQPDKLVYGKAMKVDKCGTVADRYGVRAHKGVWYTANGKRVKREGVLIKTRGAKRVVIKAHAEDGYGLVGPDTWRLTFSTKKCKKDKPEHPVDTGAPRTVTSSLHSRSGRFLA